MRNQYLKRKPLRKRMSLSNRRNPRFQNQLRILKKRNKALLKMSNHRKLSQSKKLKWMKLKQRSL